MQTSSIHICEISSLQDLNLIEELTNISIAHAYSPIWQTYHWTKFLHDCGAIQKGFCVYSDDLTCVCFLQKRSIGLRQFGLFGLGGPLLSSPGLGEAFLDSVTQLCRREKCIFVQFEPLDDVLQEYATPSKQAHLIIDGPYKRFVEPHTAWLDLTKSEEEILATMKPKGRYNIKLAQKHDVQTTWSRGEDDDIRIFYDLLLATTARNDFHQNAYVYYETLIRFLIQENLGGLLMAKKASHTIAVGIFVYFGHVAQYYYGASVDENQYRKYMASYLLQWNGIQEAKRRGCLTFDFLGVTDADGYPKHLTGVTDFKMKFNPILHRWPHTITASPSAWRYWFFCEARKWKSIYKL